MRLSHLVVAASSAAALAVSVSAGCGSDSDDADTAGSTTGTATCAPGAACTDVQSECLALVDNSASAKPGLRIMHLDVLKPAALSNQFVLDLIRGGVLLNKTECYLDGKGTFTWLLEFDTAGGQLRTGGAPPSTPEEGYCFLSGELGGQTVDPIVVPVTIDGGSFEFTEGADVVVPIYLDEAGSSYVLLPLKKARIYDATISDDMNCIGKHNTAGLKTVDQCFSTLDNPAFISGGKLDGFITLEDADSVVIKELGATLCTILAGDDDGADPAKCIRDGAGAIAFKGDWCSTTDTAGGCEDAVALGAEFAASAVKINGSCN
jgi:hypothetical protein